MKDSRFFNAITTFSRTLVGALFVVSGLIKSNDVLGFMYKLEEYFEPGALNLEAWTPYALEIAIFVCIAEVLLGIALLVGALPKLTSVLTMVMMVFFTWLTWYTATCDPFGMKMVSASDGSGNLIEIANQCVLECGCFGNAIPLTAYQSFLKDLFLLIFIIPITIAAFRNKIKLNDSRTSMVIYTGAVGMTFLFGYLMLDWLFPILYLVFLLFAASAVRRRVNSPHVEWIMAGAVVIVAGLVQFKTLNHLPLKDYRPYAIGESISENRKSADELGIDGPVYATEYTFRNKYTLLDTVVLSSDYLKVYKDDHFKSTYEIVSYDGAEIKISDGYEPRIMDFQMVNSAGDDLTETILSSPNFTLLHVSKDIESSNAAGQEAFNSLALDAIHAGWDFYGLTNGDSDMNEAFAEKNNAPYEFLTCDQTELKIVIRSNPGLVLLKDGVVMGKWAWRDIPSFNELSGDE
ncbi:MAG: hypothetical protein COA49_10155 [Bacteroidetes bacterium]|nr:MAG: hypothetical protein COA49_10155 [Bacteroidota bacterium]